MLIPKYLRFDAVVLEYLDYMGLVSTWVVMFPELLDVFWVHGSRKQSRLPYTDLLEVLETRAMSSHGGEVEEVPATQASPHQSVHQSDHGSKDEIKKRPAAHAKGKPKAHAKGKPKAQVKGKTVMKKPTTKVMKVLKKPSQKTEKPQDTKPEKKQKKWSEGLEKTEEKKEENTEESTEGPEEEVATCDEVVDPNTNFSMPQETDQKKDRSKNAKFKKMLASGALPEWLEEEWEKSKKLKTGKTERQRMLVNQSIDHAQGKLVLNTDKAVFHEMKKSWTTTASVEKEKTLPKLLLMGKFSMTEAMFDKALACGDIHEVRTKSCSLQYAWSTAEQSVTKGKSQEVEASESKDGTKKDKEWFENAAKNWKIGLFQKTGNQHSEDQEKTSSSSHCLALEDVLTDKQWNQAQQQLSLAMAAFDKVITGAKKKLQQIGPDNKEDNLYEPLNLGLQEGACGCFLDFLF